MFSQTKPEMLAIADCLKTAAILIAKTHGVGLGFLGLTVCE